MGARWGVRRGWGRRAGEGVAGQLVTSAELKRAQAKEPKSTA